jgi:hypothetical protein
MPGPLGGSSPTLSAPPEQPVYARDCIPQKGQMWLYDAISGMAAKVLVCATIARYTN